MNWDQGGTIIRNLDDALAPARLAAYDVQVGIRSQIQNGAEVVRAIRRILEVAREAGVKVFYTRHLSLARKLMGATAMAWQRTDDRTAISPWFLRDSPGFQIMPDIVPRDDEAIFDKITISAFESTPLVIALRDCGITAVMLVGIALEVGIEPSVRHAADLGFVPIVVTDACGTGNPDAAARSRIHQ